MCHTNLERVLVTLHESQIQDFKVLPNIGVFGIPFFFLFFLLRMSSSCIHVTAKQFCNEAANGNGFTNPVCTSRQSVWNVPVERTSIYPGQQEFVKWILKYES